MDEKISGENKYELPHRSRKTIILNNFIGGFFWSFGAFLGVALIGLVTGIVLSKIDLVPIIGGWLGQILERATQNLQMPLAK